MESLISRMLQDYENGKMTRRQLISALAVAGAASGLPAAGAAPTAGGFRTVALDHISYQVSDYRRTRDFYAELMGMTVTEDNGTSQCQLVFGEDGARIIARNHREPGPDRKPTVDHIAYKIADWNTDRVKEELSGHGLEPRLDTGGGDGYASFHVADPDGFDLQISGDVKPGDSLYKEE